jgi:hypothetical protein
MQVKLSSEFCTWVKRASSSFQPFLFEVRGWQMANLQLEIRNLKCREFTDFTGWHRERELNNKDPKAG